LHIVPCRRFLHLHTLATSSALHCPQPSIPPIPSFFSFFFFTVTPPSEIYTLSYTTLFRSSRPRRCRSRCDRLRGERHERRHRRRSEEHTSELQSRGHLVCRLLLEKKKTIAHGLFS